MRNVVIGMTSGDQVFAEFALCIAYMFTYTREKVKWLNLIGVINERTSLVHKGRNQIIIEAKKLKADSVLFLDTDMTFPCDTLERLAMKKKQIVGCDYMRRRPPFKNTVKEISGSYAPYNATGCREVQYIGTGCLLADLAVFDKIGEPYFDTVYDKEVGFVGEDYRFCERARLAGHQVFCDFDLSKHVGHLGVTEITFKMFERCA